MLLYSVVSNTKILPEGLGIISISLDNEWFIYLPLNYEHIMSRGGRFKIVDKQSGVF